jgi:2-desacetyl-2-hydroxyethyl bacteriochlorophyllide A dehydrogenase
MIWLPISSNSNGDSHLNAMLRQSLYFTAPRAVELRTEPLPPIGDRQALIQTRLTAISPGTELLIYRGEAPLNLAADETLAALGGALAFPLKYGYSAVGRVVELGPGVDPVWRDRLVLAFNPHETFFVADLADLIPVPDSLALEDAVFLPNMETAVNFLHDGAPLVGERVAVFGQGIVGLLTAALLARIPLAALITFDRYPLRRKLSLALGAHQSLDPQTPLVIQSSISDSLISDLQPFDLVYELSGSPAALDQALALTGFAGRIVIGSWYGTKPATLDLGGRFHRSRIKLIGSQVSTLNPALGGRWTKDRRLRFALQWLSEIKPARFITHRFPLARAAEAYALLDQQPGEAVQVVFEYD